MSPLQSFHSTEKVKTILKVEPMVRLGYVFGSMARGDALPTSDVDVAVFLDPHLSDDFFELRLKLMEKLSRALGKDVDVVILNSAPVLLRYVVLQEGELVLARFMGERFDFELKVTNEYFDYQPVMRMYNDRLLASI